VEIDQQLIAKKGETLKSGRKYTYRDSLV